MDKSIFDLAAQIGGDRFAITSILESPSADPHAYEPTSRDADAIAGADVVIENGLGYDAFADKLIAASPKADRVLLNVGKRLHRIGDNPHVWYETATLRAFVRDLAGALERKAPKTKRAVDAHRDRVLAWIGSLEARENFIAHRHAGARVAITEPVFDYVLHGSGVTVATPPAFSQAIEEGGDPAPQDVDTMQALLAQKRVAAFVYNEQTIEPATTRLLATAKSAGVAIVPVTETLPAGQTAQSWIDGEVSALDRSL